MNLQPLKSLFGKSDVSKSKKRTVKMVDKWYEYSCTNDLYNPTLKRISKLRAIDKDPRKNHKKLGSA